MPAARKSRRLVKSSTLFAALFCSQDWVPRAALSRKHGDMQWMPFYTACIEGEVSNGYPHNHVKLVDIFEVTK